MTAHDEYRLDDLSCNLMDCPECEAEGCEECNWTGEVIHKTKHR